LASTFDQARYLNPFPAGADHIARIRLPTNGPGRIEFVHAAVAVPAQVAVVGEREDRGEGAASRTKLPQPLAITFPEFGTHFANCLSDWSRRWGAVNSVAVPTHRSHYGVNALLTASFSVAAAWGIVVGTDERLRPYEARQVSRSSSASSTWR
jgi:hypothetical protein